MKKYIFLIFSVLSMSSNAQQMMTPEKLWQLGRVTPIGISKDGKSLIYKVGTPNIQENKISSYGGNNLRYKFQLKEKYITQFKKLHNEIIPWNTIRYIF